MLKGIHEGSFYQDDGNGMSSQANNVLLCRNIKKMIELIMDNKLKKGKANNTKIYACEDLGITYTSFKRWEKNPDRVIAKNPLKKIYENYNSRFVPHLSKATDLLTKDLTDEMQYINDITDDSYKLFLGYYYVYYYSAHVTDQIHFGKLRLFMEGEEFRAKLVIGIPNQKGLNDNSLSKVFERDSNTSAEFIAYKKTLSRVEETYRYYYYGTFSLSPTMLVASFSGRNKNNEENDHKFVVVINIRRFIAGQSETGVMHPYLGGMSMALSFPNLKHPSLRVFRMGISKWEIPSYGLEASESLLKHNYNDEYQRVIMSDDDDRAWFHSIARYQPK